LLLKQPLSQPDFDISIEVGLFPQQFFLQGDVVFSLDSLVATAERDLLPQQPFLQETDGTADWEIRSFLSQHPFLQPPFVFDFDLKIFPQQGFLQGLDAV